MNEQVPKICDFAFVDEIEAEVLGSIFRRSMCWMPERHAPSAWVEHVPFAFWLVDVFRPRTIVELGTHAGVSYSAFCQAVRSLGLATSCFAIDTWKGDDHAGFYSEDVYRNFTAFHDERYAAFSRLVRSTFDEALHYFKDGSIDLLHLDGLHTYEAVRNDYESWLPKLSANAIILFHDTNVRDNNFGVSRLWKEISRERFHFEFLHGHGLGVLGCGKNYSNILRLLFHSNDDKRLATAIRQTFASLGQLTRLLSERLVLDDELAGQLVSLNQLIAERDGTIAALNERLTARTSEVATLEYALSQRAGELAAARTDLAEHEAKVAALEQALSERGGELAAARIELAERKVKGKSLEAALSEPYDSSTWRIAAPPRGPKRLLVRARYSALGYLLGQAWQALRTHSLAPLRNWSATRAIARSHLFDREWYLNNNPEVKAWGIEPLRHYLAFGAREGRDPSPLFCTSAYLANNQDVAMAGVNSLAHFVLHGAREGRAQWPSVAQGSRGHDANPGSRSPCLEQATGKTPDIQTSSDVVWGLETSFPLEVYTGRGLAIPFSGWCYSKTAVIRSLEIRTGERIFQVRNHSWARPDIFRGQCPIADQVGNSLLSGFRGTLVIEPVSKPERLTLTLRVRIRGRKIIEIPIGEMLLLPGNGAVPTQVEWPAPDRPRVVICMTTYDPPSELFDVQIKSIQAQSHQNWICIVSDDHSSVEAFEKIHDQLKGDKRFYVFRNAERLGFYHNFESCLRRVPSDAEFVALCDQDDRWYPDKLEILLAAFDSETQLVYSDARLVGSDGEVRSKTFWTGRVNNYTDLASLMMANTITGAASVFRASLLPKLLPFPKPVGHAFHDHWIGLAALVNGKIGYVGQPLYDYVQHSVNVIGHNYADMPGLVSIFRQLAAAALDRNRLSSLIGLILNQATESYELVPQRVLLSRCLLIRFPEARWSKRIVLKRLARLEASLFALIQEKLRAEVHRRPTLNYEGLLLYSTVVMRFRNVAFCYLRKQLVERQVNRAIAPLPPTSAPPAIANGPVAAPARSAVTKAVASLRFANTRWIYQNISPLTLDVSHRHPRRINLLLATVDFKYVFGGYIGMFNLALRLRRAGHNVRVILTEQTDFDLSKWRRLIQEYPGVRTLFDEVEFVYRFDRSLPLEISRDDNFIATSCWSAHIAHHAVRAIGKERFMFMIQEYEPFFLPMNSVSALFRQAYEFPHFALFSTSFILDYFREQRIGVFGKQGSEAYCAVFYNAIQRSSPSRDQLARDKKRLLFYARPEDHAARNLFELGMMSLVALLRDPQFDAANWSFHGIGSISLNQAIELAPGVPIEIVPKTSLQKYIELLPSFDVGLSLMLTPHPSLVPLEMAAAGMWTVTNTFANKTAERLKAISTNLIGVEPTVAGVCEGLLKAISNVNDLESRLAGAEVTWPTDWTSAFPSETMEKMEAFLGNSDAVAPY